MNWDLAVREMYNLTESVQCFLALGQTNHAADDLDATNYNLKVKSEKL